MVAIIQSVALAGFTGVPVEVEADIRQGLPGMQIVGMGNKSIDEARERVKSSIRNSSLTLPSQKLTINLAPAEMPKDGTHFDLPIALSILVASGQLQQRDATKSLFIGELALDGRLRAVRGAVFAAETAAAKGMEYVFAPIDNLEQIKLIKDVTPIGVSSLQELYYHLRKVKPIDLSITEVKKEAPSLPAVTVDDIQGHDRAKHALKIAASGRHNLLLSGPPGSGKSLLAKALHSLLPPLSSEAILEVTKIHSIHSGDSGQIMTEPPFRSPHHTSTITSVIGGGVKLRPGEVSLAHKGVLLLDELPEFSRQTLESLRQPLEEKTVSINRHGRHVNYPADALMIATMNPCPCGLLGSEDKKCSCTAMQISNYKKKLSGPLLDRIDLRLAVQKVPFEQITNSKALKSPQQPNLLEDVKNAHLLQHKRYNSRLFYNANATVRQIKTVFNISKAAEDFAIMAAQKLALSTRSYYRVLRISRTIADLANSKSVEQNHVTEALQFRDI